MPNPFVAALFEEEAADTQDLEIPHLERPFRIMNVSGWYHPTRTNSGGLLLSIDPGPISK